MHYISPSQKTTPESSSAEALTMPPIASVVVTYKPSEESIRTINKIASQSKKVVVVDNTPHSQLFITHLQDVPNIEVVKNPTNLGLATALNIGIRTLQKEGFRWIATFDQDTMICDSYFSKLFHCFSATEKNYKVALVSGRHFDADSKQPLLPAGPSATLKLKTTITSGNLLNIANLENVGFFDDSMFIDYLDHDFCLRIRKNHLRIIECPNAILTHRLGAPKWHKIGPFTFMATHHSPARYYYMSRNRFRVYWRYWNFDPAWVLGDLKNFVKEITKVLLVEGQKSKKILYIILGALQIRLTHEII